MSRTRRILWCGLAGVACALATAVVGQFWHSDENWLERTTYFEREEPIDKIVFMPWVVSTAFQTSTLYCVDHRLDAHPAWLDESAMLGVASRLRSRKTYTLTSGTNIVLNGYTGVCYKTVGWPFRCFGGLDFHTYDRTEVKRSTGTFVAWRTPDTADESGILIVYRPLWAGLLANCVLFASAFAMAGWTIGAFVRRRRARSGGCAGCGYDRTGIASSAPCPECGRTAKPAAAEPSA